MKTTTLAFSAETKEVAPSTVTINQKEFETDSPRLVKLLLNSFERVASQKTMKYFISDTKFGQRLVDVVQTIEAIRCSHSNTIVVDDESYSVGEYKIPVKLTDYVNSGIIYASSDAAGSCEPIFKVEGCAGKLTPLQFNKFFNDFNENQENKLDTVDSFNRSCTILGDVQYAEDEKGRMVKLKEGGYNMETCYLIGLKVSGTGENWTTYSAPSAEGLTKWLFG